MAERHLNLAGLNPGQAKRRLHATLSVGNVLPTDEVSALIALCQGRGALGAMRVEERHGTLRRMLHIRGKERPVLLWLDDVHWGLDALMFAEHLLEAQSFNPTPVLILATVRAEALPNQPAQAHMLDDLEARDDVTPLHVPPMAPARHRELVRGLLGLEDRLASLVEQRTAGNPLFAVHLVGDWVARGLLCRADPTGAGGFRLKPGARVDLPDDMHSVWTSRIDALMAHRPESDEVALQAAAILGQDVDREEWDRANDELDIVPSDDLVESLDLARLAFRSERGLGWSFVHGMLRESFERRASEAGRYARLHLTCAAVVGRRGGPQASARVGRHLLAAGHDNEAIAPLLDGARRALKLNQLANAADLLERRENALHRLGSAPGDPRWGAGWILGSEARRRLGNVHAAMRQAKKAIRHADTFQWHDIANRANTELGISARQQGDLPTAEGHLRQALVGFTERGDPRGRADALLGLCHVNVLQGDLPSAAERAREAREVYRSLGHRAGVAQSVRFEGDIARLRRDWSTAQARFEQAMELHRVLEDRAGVATNLHGIAEVLRFRGDLKDAEQGYRQVIRLEEHLGNAAGTIIPKLNLALCLIKRHQWPDAKQQLADVVRSWTRRQHHGYLGCAHAALAPCAAATADWRGFDLHLSEAHERINRAGMVDLDIAWPMQLAGDLAARAGQIPRGIRAWRVALAQYTALGDTDRAEEVRACLNDLR